MKLVADWKTVHRHISFVCMALFNAALGVYVMLPESLQNAISQTEARSFAFALIALGMIGKYVDQGNEYGDSKND